MSQAQAEQFEQVHSLVRKARGMLQQYLPADAEHGNQRLHDADLVGLLLSAAMDTTVRSLRLIEQFSATDDMRRVTGRSFVPRSTLADRLAAFDPERLRPIIEHVQQSMPWLKRADEDAFEVGRRVIAADGSWFNLAGEVVHALSMSRGRDGRQSRVRLNLQLDIERLLPVECDVSGAGDGSEAAAFKRRLIADCVYVVDRNFVHFGFINAVFSVGSNLVLRLRKDTHFDVHQPSALSERDIAAGVQEDHQGILCGQRSATNVGRPARTELPPKQTLRRIVIRDEKNDTDLILLTDLLEIPAWMVGEIYRQRWRIELFLRWLKVFAGFEHLINQSARGITTQFYVAVLMTLLLHMRTGMPVSKHTLHLLTMVAAGQMSAEATALMLARRLRERQLEQARAARKKLK